MNPVLPAITEAFPEEDSEDLTDEEIESSVEVKSAQEIGVAIKERIAVSEGVLKGHELRKRGEHLYWRTRLVGPTGEEVLVFQVDWLGKLGKPAEGATRA